MKTKTRKYLKPWNAGHDNVLKKMYSEGWSSVEMAYRLFKDFGVQRTSGAVGQRITVLLAEKKLKARDKSATRATKEAVAHMSKVDGRPWKSSHMLKIVETTPVVQKPKPKKTTRKAKSNGHNGHNGHRAADGLFKEQSYTAVFTRMARDYPSTFQMLGQIIVKAEAEKKTLQDIARDIVHSIT